MLTIIIEILSKYWKYILAGALMGGLFLYGDYHGHEVVQKQFDSFKQELVDKQVALENAQKLVVSNQFSQYQAKVKVVHDVAKTIYVKVPVYVTSKDDSACTINNGFVSVWNASNQGVQLPNDPSGVNESSSGVKLSDVARQHSNESEYTHGLEQQVISLQNILKGLEKANAN